MQPGPRLLLGNLEFCLRLAVFPPLASSISARLSKSLGWVADNKIQIPPLRQTRDEPIQDPLHTREAQLINLSIVADPLPTLRVPASLPTAQRAWFDVAYDKRKGLCCATLPLPYFLPFQPFNYLFLSFPRCPAGLSESAFFLFDYLLVNELLTYSAKYIL